MKEFRYRIIISVYVGLFILALYSTVHSYYLNINLSKDKVFSNLELLSRLISANIDGDAHEKITKTIKVRDGIKSNFQNADYRKIHVMLEKARRKAHIKNPIYTIVLNRKDNDIFYAITSSIIPVFRHTYKHPPQELLNYYRSGARVDAYREETGHWLSAFTPILNSKNQVVAVVQVDQNFNEFYSDINSELIKNLLLIVIFYIITGVCLVIYLKKAIANEEEYKLQQKDLKRVLEEKVQLRTKELDQSNKKLQKLNKELESFFYSTSHDIRGPLCRIMGLSQLAKAEAKNQEFVELIDSESHKMDNMLRRLIYVHNIRNKNLKIQPVNLYETISEEVNNLKLKYERINANDLIKVEIPFYQTFYTDMELFKVITRELLDNAFKYRKSKRLEVTLRLQEDDDMNLNLLIKDYGAGFDEESLPIAFDLFKKTTGHPDGMSLGLYTSKIATDRLNGDIVIMSSKNQFTEIKVTLPPLMKQQHISFSDTAKAG